MKNKKLTKSEINFKLLNKYKVSIDGLNYDALKSFKNNIKQSTNILIFRYVKTAFWIFQFRI